jgi:hypothetical protein
MLSRTFNTNLPEELTACCFDWPLQRSGCRFLAQLALFSFSIAKDCGVKRTTTFDHGFPWYLETSWAYPQRPRTLQRASTGWVLRGVRTPQNPHIPWRKNTIGGLGAIDRQVEHATRAGLGDLASTMHCHASTHPRMPPAELSHSLALNLSFLPFLLFFFSSFLFPSLHPPLAIGPLLVSNSEHPLRWLFAQSFIRAWTPCTGPIFSSAKYGERGF